MFLAKENNSSIKPSTKQIYPLQRAVQSPLYGALTSSLLEQITDDYFQTVAYSTSSVSQNAEQFFDQSMSKLAHVNTTIGLAVRKLLLLCVLRLITDDE